MICLLCCSSASDFITLASEQSKRLNIPSILFKYFRFLFENEPETGEICHKCWLKVEMFHEFYRRIEEIHIVEDTIIVETLQPIIKSDDEFSDNDGFSDRNFNDDFDDFNQIDDTKPLGLCPETTNDAENAMIEDQKSSELIGTDEIKLEMKNDGKPEPERDKFYTKLKSKSSKWAYKCDLCNEKFVNIVGIKEHLKIKHVLSFQCPLCDKTFLNPITLKTHTQKFHDPTREKKKDVNRKPCEEKFKSIKCNECSEYFLTDDHLLTHQKTTHLALPFKCNHHPRCKESFETAQLLEEHKNNAHVKVQCPHCSKKVTQLDVHIQRIHNKAFQTICEQCGKVFSGDFALKHHIRIEHEHRGPLICDICGDTFKGKETIRSHMKYIHVQGPQKCLTCGKVLANERSLQKHQKVHNEALKEKYKCNVCGKGFRDATKLREHSYIHTGKTDAYTCQFCGKTFRFGSSFSAHRMKYHPAEMAHMKERLQKHRNMKLNKI